MISISYRRTRLLAAGVLVMAALPTAALAQDEQDTKGFSAHFRVSSTTFNNDQFLPLVTINNLPVSGTTTNSCTANGLAGGNQSPELSWTGAPWQTRSFVVTTFDVTASFTHWGIYNIPASVTELPQNAGVANSTYGSEVLNDFGLAEYDGPCPPMNVVPDVHRYVFTVYALDIELSLPDLTNFPNNAETLYHALLKAYKGDHVLATASITGLYSATK